MIKTTQSLKPILKVILIAVKTIMKSRIPVKIVIFVLWGWVNDGDMDILNQIDQNYTISQDMKVIIISC